MDEVTGCWRESHIEELRNLYSSLDWTVDWIQDVVEWRAPVKTIMRFTITFFFPVALQSFRTLSASHIGGFLSYSDIW
jgi:hypothetical protein